MLRSLILAGTAAFFGFTAASAAEVEPAVAKRHVNLSALQPMLAEQIAKAACFAGLGINASANIGYLAGSYALFDKTRQGLRHGSAALGLVEETNQSVLLALNELDRVSNIWSARVDAAAGSNSLSEEAVFSIVAGSAQVVEAARVTAEKAERVYATGSYSFPLETSLRIKLASRQRTLSQRMAKDFCLIESGMNAEAHRASLKEAIDLFQASLGALKDGFPAFNLDAEMDPEKRAQLEFVASLWDEVRPIYTRVAEGAAPTAAELRLIAWQNNQILSQMNAAVFSYETRGASG